MKIKKGFERIIRDGTLRTVEIAIRERGKVHSLVEFSKDVLHNLNVEGQYLQSDNQEFKQMRKKLNQEPGLIISNHPGYFDMPLVLSNINRDDLKIIVAENFYPSLTRRFGADKFIKSTRELVRKSSAHIKNGGAILIFPTGGADIVIKRDQAQKTNFRSGFRHILNSVNPDSMVYSFYIDPQDDLTLLNRYSSKKTIKNLQIAGQALALWEPDNIGSSKKSVIKVDENISRVQDWQKEIKNIQGSIPQNEKLTQVYFDQFIKLDKH